MPNGDNQTKKLMNNGRLRAAIASMLAWCDAAEGAASGLTGEEVVGLCAADRRAVAALERCAKVYDATFNKAEERLVKKLAGD